MKPHHPGPIVVVSAVALLTACGLLPAARPQATPARTSAPAVATSAGSEATPRSTPAVPDPSRGSAGSQPTMATPSVPDNGDEETQPPAGILVSGNQRVAGELGTYCYQNLCADRIAWPPKTELPLLNATRMFLGFELDNREPFARWTASYGTRANDDPIATLGQGGAAFDPDASGSAPEFREITFRRPPAGDWVVWVRVDLANGDLEYAWHVTVIPDTGS